MTMVPRRRKERLKQAARSRTQPKVALTLFLHCGFMFFLNLPRSPGEVVRRLVALVCVGSGALRIATLLLRSGLRLSLHRALAAISSDVLLRSRLLLLEVLQSEVGLDK